MEGAVAERYLRLGLQFGRHADGIVDAYYGPPELAAAVAAEPPVEPRVLVSTAEALLDELEDGWLRDQVTGLRTYAGVLAGESITYADEVLYPAYEVAPRIVALSPHEDQLVGGLIMWIPGTFILIGVATVMFFRWAKMEEARH